MSERNRIRILLIEDSPDDALLLRETLAAPGPLGGYEIAHEESLGAALARLARESFDVVLLDLGLPDSRGLETLERALAASEEVPIVVLTSLDDEALGVRALQAGAQDYLVKGRTDASLLERAIRYARERQRLLVAQREQYRRFTADLEARNRELDASNQALDEFGLIASHDLREPLRAIEYRAETLLEEHGAALGEDGRRKVESLVRLSHRLSDLIEALYTYSRVGRIELAIVDVDLHRILMEVVDSLSDMLKREGVNVRIPTRLPVVRCDRVRVGEIFRNLIVNAALYNDKPEKWVEVGCSPEGEGRGGPVYYVRDNGIGIREDKLEWIFQIFKRLHGREKFGGGPGAGLTIVKRLVERHGGRIWVQSRYGIGTTFFFTLS